MDIFRATQFNVGDYLQIIFRRKWLFIGPFLTIFLSVTIGSFFLPKIYQSTAILLVEEKQLLTPLVKGMAVTPTIQERLDILKEQMTSWYRLEEMIKELGGERDIRGVKKIEFLVQSLRKKIDVSLKGPHLVQISFDDEDPHFAQKVVNYITEGFVRESLSDQAEEVDSTINFIKQQVEIYRKKLEDSESALKKFKEEHLLSLPGSAGSDLDKAMGIQDAILQINLDLQEAQRTKETLQKQLTGQEKIITTSKTTSTNPIIQQLTAKLLDLQTQLSDLRAKKCTDGHPWVISLKENIAQVEKQIQEESSSGITDKITETNPVYQEIESKLHDTETLIESLLARQKHLQYLLDKYGMRAKSVPTSEEEYTRLTRDMDVNESIYAMLLNRLETANISQRLEQAERGTRFKVIEPAKLPLSPIKPNKPMLIFLGFLMGSILGCGCVFLGEYTDHSLRGLEDAESVLGIPSLGSISKIITFEEVRYQQKRRKRITTLTIIMAISILLASLFVSLLIKR